MDPIRIFDLKQINVPNGDLFHGLKCTDEGYQGFGEAYFTHIQPNKIKGWKRHNRVTLNLIVIYGEVKFYIFNDTQSKNQLTEIILSPVSNYKRLVVPPGYWVAFKGMGNSESIILDIINEPHDHTEADKRDLLEIPLNQ